MSAVSAGWRARPHLPSLLSPLSIAATRYRHRNASLTDSTCFEEQPPWNFDPRPRRVARIVTVYRPVDARSNREQKHRDEECCDSNNRILLPSLLLIQAGWWMAAQGMPSWMFLRRNPKPRLRSQITTTTCGTPQPTCGPTEISWSASRVVVLSHSFPSIQRRV